MGWSEIVCATKDLWYTDYMHDKAEEACADVPAEEPAGDEKKQDIREAKTPLPDKTEPLEYPMPLHEVHARQMRIENICPPGIENMDLKGMSTNGIIELFGPMTPNIKAKTILKYLHAKVIDTTESDDTSEVVYDVNKTGQCQLDHLDLGACRGIAVFEGVVTTDVPDGALHRSGEHMRLVDEFYSCIGDS